MRIIALFISLCLVACRLSTRHELQPLPALYNPPVVVKLDTIQGYTTNLITGEVIANGNLESGQGLATGRAKPLIATAKFTNQKLPTETTLAIPASQFYIPTNERPIKSTVQDGAGPGRTFGSNNIQANTQPKIALLKKEIHPTTNPFSITVKKIKATLPVPEPTSPMTYKEGATSDIQQFGVAEGLSFPYVYALHQDSSGNYWFGTDGMGVTKYDGIQSFHYQAKHGLLDNWVYAMQTDGKGNLWFGGQNGLTEFDGHHFYQYAFGTNSPNHKTSLLLADADGNIWRGTESGNLYKMEAQLSQGMRTWKATAMAMGALSSGLGFNTAMADKHNNLWFGTSKGLMILEWATKRWYSYTLPAPARVSAALHQSADGSIWMAHGDELAKLLVTNSGKEIATIHVQDAGIRDNQEISAITSDRYGHIWMATIGKGVKKYSPAGLTCYTISDGLTSNNIRRVMADNTGDIWVSSDGGGVNRIRPSGFSYPLKADLLGTNKSRPITIDHQGGMWTVVGQGPLLRIQRPGIAASGYTVAVFDNLELEGNERKLLVDAAGTLWAGTNRGKLYRQAGNKWIRYALPTEANPTSLFSATQDAKGNIWLGTNFHLPLICFNGRTFTFYTAADGIPQGHILNLYTDTKGVIWIGIEGQGLLKLDGHMLTQYTAKEGMFGSGVSAMVQDANGLLWMATIGAGVCSFDGEKFTYYTQQQGLSNNHVWSLLKDETGALWAGTDQGLNKLVPAGPSTGDSVVKMRIQNFGLQDGLKALDFNLHSAVADGRGFLWWGTGKGLVRLHQPTAHQMAAPQFLNIRTISINDQLMDFNNLTDSTSKLVKFDSVPAFRPYAAGLKLNHTQNHLAFSFSAQDADAHGQIKYSYRLLGIDNKWSKPAALPKAEFRGLSPGKYEFQVAAIGAAQQWTAPISYSFVLQPAWWQTLWFKALSILLALGICIWWVRMIYVIRWRKQKAILEKELAVQEERQRIAAEMHDDIGSGLSGLRLLTEITRNKLSTSDSAEGIDKIHSSIGDLSGKIREVIWSLNTDHDTLQNLVYYLHKEARQMLEHYPAQVKFQLPETVLHSPIGGETRRNLLLVMKEALHNVIKHSGASVVNVVMKVEANGFHLTIADNGKGLPSDTSMQAGNGLINMRRRMEAVGGTFQMQSSHGTVLVFEMPINQSS